MEKHRCEESEKRREEKRRREKIKDQRSKIKDQRSEIREEKESEERVTRKSQKKESEERVRRKKIQVREKVGKSRNTVFFQWLLAPEGRKVGSLKRRVRSHLARWEIKNCIQLWREAHFQVKMYKTHQRRITFGSCDVEKVHAAVARSTLRSQNLQNTPFLEHFWNVRCRKSVRRCGPKHISKSKCTKHTMFGALLEVEMFKKCTLLWREAHFQAKSVKHWRVRGTFGRSDVSRGRRKGLCTLSKVSKTWGFCSNYNHYTTLHFTTLQVQLQLHYITLHYTNYITLH